jgi:hypothetical protein
MMIIQNSKLKKINLLYGISALPPKDFPNSVKLKITDEEAGFIKEQLRCHCGESLLAYLLNSYYSQDVTVPWEHPQFENFDFETQKLLNHAEFFSSLFTGLFTL